MYKGRLENTGQASGIGCIEWGWVVKRHAWWRTDGEGVELTWRACGWVAAGGGGEAAGSQRAAGEPGVSGRGVDAESAAPPESCKSNRVLRRRRSAAAGVRVHAAGVPGGSSTW